MALQAAVTLAALILATPSAAQVPTGTYNRPPEVSVVTATTPAVNVPGADFPVVPSELQVSNAPPASTELLATRHFDYIVSPAVKIAPGSMADTSISLGEYARGLREQKQRAGTLAAPFKQSAPAMAQPSTPR